MGKEIYKKRTYLLMTVDPVHIGTGGYRLGRVDNSIVREPGTNLPKIPGTSLSGVIRRYAAYQLKSSRCAGQGGQGDEAEHVKKSHCGKCPVCYTFGYTRGDDSQSYSGTINVFDAQLLFFPVYSFQGPVWVATRALLENAKFEKVPQETIEKNQVMLSWQTDDKFLNLGWILLDATCAQKPPEAPEKWRDRKELSTILAKTVIVTPELFSHIVNSNLEVRTSVSIDPETGAAKKGALFTYEAIPRAAFLTCDVIQDDYRKTFGKTKEWCNEHADEYNTDIAKSWEDPLAVLHSGLKLANMLGVGGMGTRGFGRINALAFFEYKNSGGAQ